MSLLQLTKTWRRLLLSCHDDAAQFVAFLTQGSRNYLMPEDFVPLIQDVVDTHPGLLFLKEATEFHSRYVHTVIARIFYEVNRSWSGKITVSELRRSKFLSTLKIPPVYDFASNLQIVSCAKVTVLHNIKHELDLLMIQI